MRSPNKAHPPPPPALRWQVAARLSADMHPGRGRVRLRVQQASLDDPHLLFCSKVPLPGAEPNCGPEEYKPDGLGLCCRKCPAGESQGVF